MRILVTNDDGINAPGLPVLEAIAASLSDDVWTVAPETEQSGASHSLTLHQPVRLRQHGDRDAAGKKHSKRFSLSGTPTDCVVMGVKHVQDAKGDNVPF
ncbi:MAG: 5'/3'-nucleotidase SurE, partial [Pseudomonadota bacterium]